MKHIFPKIILLCALLAPWAVQTEQQAQIEALQKKK